MVCSIDRWIIHYKSNEEALSFCATILLAVVGLGALLVAFGQSRHAKKARLAETLIGLSKSLDALSPYQKLIDTCLVACNANSLGEQQTTILGVLDGTIAYPHRELVSQSVDTMLSFIEDMGLLCRGGYVEKKDLFDIMGGIILSTLERSMKYIERERQTYGRNTYYSNALWLYYRVRVAPRFAFYGHGLPTPNALGRLSNSLIYRFAWIRGSR